MNSLPPHLLECIANLPLDLDSEQRIIASRVIKRFIMHAKKTAFIVEHDFIMATYLADRVIVFDGQPGIDAHANKPESLLTGCNTFLKNLDVTFRRDPTNYRPRINKLNSQLDQEQKLGGNYVSFHPASICGLSACCNLILTCLFFHSSSWTIPRRAVKEGISRDVLHKNNKNSGRGNTQHHRRCYDDASDSGVLGVQKENGSSSIHCGARDDGGSGGGRSGSEFDASSEDDEPDD